MTHALNLFYVTAKAVGDCDGRVPSLGHVTHQYGTLCPEVVYNIYRTRTFQKSFKPTVRYNVRENLASKRLH